MKKNEVRLDVTYNTGNYTSARLGMTASLETGDTVFQAFKNLKKDIDHAFNVLTGKVEPDEVKVFEKGEKTSVCRRGRLFFHLCDRVSEAAEPAKTLENVLDEYNFTPTAEKNFRNELALRGVDLSKPETPTQPAQQTQPAQPVQQAQPTQPAQPTQSAQPIQQAQPVQPAQQTQPGKRITVSTLENENKIFIDRILEKFRETEYPYFGQLWQKLKKLYSFAPDVRDYLLNSINEIGNEKIKQEFKNQQKK